MRIEADLALFALVTVKQFAICQVFVIPSYNAEWQI